MRRSSDPYRFSTYIVNDNIRKDHTAHSRAFLQYINTNNLDIEIIEVLVTLVPKNQIYFVLRSVTNVELFLNRPAIHTMEVSQFAVLSQVSSAS